MAHAHRSDQIVTPDGIVRGALLVEQGRILALCRADEIPDGAELHDHRPAAILPGLVDTHVHLNEPGRSDWEGFESGTEAAAAGGFTTLVDMPLNSLPETTTVAALEAKRNAAQGACLIDWAAWGGCVADNRTQLAALAEAGVRGFKAFLLYPGCEGFTEVDQRQLEAALPAIAATGLPLLVHAELAGPIEVASRALTHADWRRYSTYLASRPDEAELKAIHLLLELCAKHRFPLHIVHLATALALPLLAAAKSAGLPVTVETCPHYLYFAAEEIPDGSTLHKCAPPIRSRNNREALWRGLREGIIDLIATDHSPCLPWMKRLETGRFDEAWGGIAGLSLALPLLHTEAVARGFTLVEIARWLSSAPARLAGLEAQCGLLGPGREASFTVFDPAEQWTVRERDLHFRHLISPYLGERLQGRVLSTWLRGQLVYEHGTFADTRTGHELRLS